MEAGDLGYINNLDNYDRVVAVINGAIKHELYVIIAWHTPYAEDHLSKAIAFFGDVAHSYGMHNTDS